VLKSSSSTPGVVKLSNLMSSSVMLRGVLVGGLNICTAATSIQLFRVKFQIRHHDHSPPGVLIPSSFSLSETWMTAGGAGLLFPGSDSGSILYVTTDHNSHSPRRG
jgi:hypothetical protein